MVKSVAVIGAGPAGLTAAYQLAKAGVAVTVFEAGAAVGGMARTVSLWGQRVDLGPHRFFSNDARVNRLWFEVVGDRYSMVNRLTRIRYRHTFFNYPLQPRNALLGLGPIEALRCVMSYARAQLRPEPDETTFESWVVNRFGRRLFETFFKSYSEKLWGIRCTELDADFAAQRIRKFSLSEAIRAALFSPRGAAHRTLADMFAYPHGGSGAVYDEMARRIAAMGGTVVLNTPVAAVVPTSSTDERPKLELANGGNLAFDHIVSTMPITQLLARMSAPRDVEMHAAQLRFRNTILVYLRVTGDRLFPDQWIYVHSPELATGRITNFRNWHASLNQDQPDTILCLEYWCNEPDPIWTEVDEALIRRATDDAYRSGLVPADKIEAGHVLRVPKCYPIYAAGYRGHLRPVQDFLAAQRGLSVIGRYGAFKYNNQDHSILMGMLAAENIVSGARHDLWAVNSDDEYQEASQIAAEGASVKQAR
ncbi:MAG: FAD-dependent oxidoreductase [Alphaproteobacteria bacterium]